MVVTTRWQTVATISYTAPVRHPPNQQAHGAVCHLQVRKNGKGELLGRKVNSNGKHIEIGVSFLLDQATLTHWISIACWQLVKKDGIEKHLKQKAE